MDETLTHRLTKLEREARLWRLSTLLLIALGLVSWGVRPLVAQQARTAKVTLEYRQSRCLWPQMSAVLNEWEGKGWETFEIVPIQAENPGAGGQMQVAVVFRRPSK